MKLQIITTHYKESPKTVYQLLDSIKVQQFVNFREVEIIIVNDGDFNPLAPEKLKTYPFNILNITKAWGGLSESREVGLAEATADYVMFCDCDDMFSSVEALARIFTAIDLEKRDLIITSFLHDIYDNDRCIIELHQASQSLGNYLIHGKIFKRQFLNDNNIHWNEKIKTWHEDYYFMMLVAAAVSSISVIDTPVYIYKTTPGSVTDVSKEERIVQELRRLLIEYELLSELKQRNYKFFIWKLIDALFNCYFWSSTGKYLKNPIDTMKISVMIMSKYKEDFLKLTSSMIKQRVAQYDTDKLVSVTLNAGSFSDWLATSLINANKELNNI